LTDIRPFHGIHYIKSAVGDMANVICPPYDVITSQKQQELYELSEYNYVRLEYERELPQDTDNDNKYTRSAATLEKWLDNGILERDEKPAFYLHDHYFTYQGEEYRRSGIIAIIHLEEWDKKIIRPHEGTLAKPKGDRLSLMWALKANTSPIFGLYEDRKQKIASLVASQGQGKPVISLTSDEGERHNIWAITDQDIINQIQEFFGDHPLYIADGHHRYESALTYQRERITCAPESSGKEGYNFTMMTLVAFSDPGLVILPPHRLIRGLSKSALEELKSKLSLCFEIEPLSLDTPDIWQHIDNVLAEKSEQVRFVLFGPGKEGLFILKLRSSVDVGKMMPYFHSDIYKNLDVSIIDHVILGDMLGISQDIGPDFLTYSYDRQDTLNKVIDHEYQLAFLLNPIKPEVIKNISDIGDRMPRKSTYFYPKLPSGLIFYHME